MEHMKNQAIFKDIERAGEEFKEQFKQLAKNAQIGMDSKVQSAKFEAAYALTVSKEQRKITMTEVKEIRGDLWEQAMKKANGDSVKASIFYEKICEFP